MSSPDLLLLLGPLGAPILVPVSVAILVLRRRPSGAVQVGVLLVAVVVTSWLAYWFNWGRAFDYGDALQPVPASLEARLNALLAVTAFTTILLALTAGVSLATKRRQP